MTGLHTGTGIRLQPVILANKRSFLFAYVHLLLGLCEVPWGTRWCINHKKGAVNYISYNWALMLLGLYGKEIFSLLLTALAGF